MKILLNVPYYSQFIEVEDSFWNIRSCGGACIKMCLDYYGKESPSVLDIMLQAKSSGGYDMKNGFVHDWAVEYFLTHGLHSYRKEGLVGLDEILNSLKDNNPVIVSISKRVLEQSKFHLILVVGCEVDDNGKVISLTYHEPERTDEKEGAFRVCDAQIFINSWRQKGIFVSA